MSSYILECRIIYLFASRDCLVPKSHCAAPHTFCEIYICRTFYLFFNLYLNIFCYRHFLQEHRSSREIMSDYLQSCLHQNKKNYIKKDYIKTSGIHSQVFHETTCYYKKFIWKNLPHQCFTKQV